MRATFSFASDTCIQLINYVKNEQKTEGCHGFDVKNVSSILWYYCLNQSDCYHIIANVFFLSHFNHNQSKKVN